MNKTQAQEDHDYKNKRNAPRRSLLQEQDNTHQRRSRLQEQDTRTKIIRTRNTHQKDHDYKNKKHAPKIITRTKHTHQKRF